MQKYNKLVRVGDRSAGGWMKVQDYVSEKLATDSDDSGKTYQTKRRTTEKKELTFPKNFRQRFHLLPSLTSRT